MAPTASPHRPSEHRPSEAQREPDRRPLLRAVLGEVLRRERGQQRRTLADVAAAAQVSMPYLSEIERGRKEASSEVLSAVCLALRVELSAVLSETAADLAAHGQARARVLRLQSVRAERVLGTRAPASIAARSVPARRGHGAADSPLCLAA